MTINILYENARTGDASAETQLFKILTVRFRLIALRRLRNREAAEEVVQDALIKILEGFREMNFEISFSAWAYKVLHNRLLNYIRDTGRHRRIVSSMEDESEGPSYQTPQYSKRMIMECLKKLIAKNNRYARVLNLKNQGYDLDEICRRLNLTSDNLYVLLHRSRLAMRSCLEKGIHF